MLSKKWEYHSPLRNHFERRQALIEIDVLSSMSINLTLNELITLYSIQCPVFKQYEEDTFYDSSGNIVFTVNRGLPNTGFPRKSSKNEPIGWEDIKDMQSGTVSRAIIDDTMPGGPIERTITYEAPFDRCDREKDYETAWTEFERRFKQHEGKS